MCMVAAAVTKDYGILATDSARYDIEKEEVTFESPKLYFTGNNKYLISYIGTHLYFSNIDHAKFELPLDALSMYLTDYLKGMKPKVAKMMASEISDKDDQKPNVCLYVMGMHKNIPTLAIFNVYQDFEPKYIWTKDEVKFGNTYYGGEEEGKEEVFTEAVEYMKKRMKRYEKLTPGLLGEILTRGIYKKADLEEKLSTKTKYAGGVVNVGIVMPSGVFGLSGMEGIRTR